MVGISAARVGAVLLAVLALVHVYWAAGATRPAGGERGLSLAVLGSVVSFGPTVTLPLAVDQQGEEDDRGSRRRYGCRPSAPGRRCGSSARSSSWTGSGPYGMSSSRSRTSRTPSRRRSRRDARPRSETRGDTHPQGEAAPVSG